MHASLLHSLALANGRHGVHVTKGSQLVSVLSTTSVDSGSAQPDAGCGVMLDAADGQWVQYARVVRTTVHNGRAGGVCVVRASGVELYGNRVTSTRKGDACCFKTEKAEDVAGAGNFCDADDEQGVCRDGGEKAKGVCEGKEASGQCCPSTCESCGGDGCSQFLPRGACCVADVKNRKRKCFLSMPPCTV